MFNTSAKKIDIALDTISEINYNNYLTENSIDYKGNWFVWQKESIFRNKTIAQNAQNEIFNLKNSDKPLQIRDNQLFWIKNNQLKMQVIGAKKVSNIADNIERFIVRQNDVIYLTQSELVHENRRNKLYCYDFSSEKSILLYEDIQHFYVHHEKLFVIDNKNVLIEVQTNGKTFKKVFTFPVDYTLVNVMPQGDNLVFIDINNVIIFDVKNGCKQTVSLSNSGYVNNDFSLICDDENIFVSFQATETNGSLVKNIDDEHNGLWFIDPKTLQKKKISDYVFDQLYLFQNTQLFGIQGNNLFQIDVASGQVTPVNLIEKDS